MKIKKLARKLQAEISEDPALAKASYCWCLEQVLARLENPTSPISPSTLIAERCWPAFVAEVKTRARKAG